MASSRNSFLNYFGGGGGGERVTPPKAGVEFEESDVWNPNDSVQSDQSKNSTMISNNSRPLKKPIIMRKSNSTNTNNNQINKRSTAAATSLPVNVPDWSRILGNEYKNHRREGEDDVVYDDDDEEDDEYGRLPPHEYLARTRGSSFSVQEGVGRTLKGRDLSRVRNAVWKQIGFED